MIKSKKDIEPSALTIDLTGPQGNAFFLIGTARKLAKKLGREAYEIEAIVKEMMDGDYEYLIDVFEAEFGDYVILYR